MRLIAAALGLSLAFTCVAQSTSTKDVGNDPRPIYQRKLGPPPAYPADHGLGAAPASEAKAEAKPAKEAAPGGGPGKVWLNTLTGVYHCYGGKNYGTTKKGEYMTEAEAKAKGGRLPAHETSCEGK